VNDTLSLERKDGIATVALLGATMTPAFFDELREVFADIASTPEIRAVVIRSDAKVFSYGLDLPAAFQSHGRLFAGGKVGDRLELLGLIRKLQDGMDALRRLPVPVIAAVHGYCLGGGIDLISACDFRFCTADAAFSVRETKVAIVADLGTLQRLTHIVGQGHAREMAFTGRNVSATEAVAMGLCNRSLHDKETLWNHASEVAAEIAENSPLAVRGAKEVMNFSDEHGTRAGLEYVAAWNSAFLASEDLGEAVMAFTQKRPPKFRGR